MLTQEAAETIRLLVDAPDAEGVRISHADESLDGRGAALQIAVVSAPEPEDVVIDAEGAFLYLDSNAERAMDDKVLHANVEGSEIRFELLEQAGSDGD
jgi:hypothetical protein